MTHATAETEHRLSGLPVSDGVALARVQFVESARHAPIPFYLVPTRGIADEKERLKRAIEVAALQIEDLITQVTERIGPASANIFVAQKMMVLDETWHHQMYQVIEGERINAEAALAKTLDSYESLLSEVDDEYLKERASDIGEIRRRLLEILRQDTSGPGAAVSGADGEDEARIVVAEDLTPSETVALDQAHTVGFITQRGGTGSHAAILARALGIPAVSGIRDVAKTFATGESVLLNGTTGEVVLRPSNTTRRLYPAAERSGLPSIRAVEPVEGIVVMANISLATEVESIARLKPQGIGMYRTEFEFLAAGRMLSEDEQYERYAAVLRAMAGKPVLFRMLDFGGDKPAPFLDIPQEENPCLGLRGARLLLEKPELIIPQARALARASAEGPVRVVYPMVAHVAQFLKLREIFRQSVGDITQGEIRHGVMLEVPSACLAIREMFDVADFATVGSNDLIQFLFAVDRNNETVAGDYNPDHPVFWDLLRDIAQAADEAGRPLSLCGEIGSQPDYLPRLLDMGINTVSVSARLIGLARLAARRHFAAQARRQAAGR